MDLELIIRKKQIQRDLRILKNDKKGVEKMSKVLNPELSEELRYLVEIRLEKTQKKLIEINRILSTKN